MPYQASAARTPGAGPWAGPARTVPPLPPLPPGHVAAPAPPGAPTATSTALRPGPGSRLPRTAAVVALFVLGLGLVGGALAGNWLLDDDPDAPTAVSRFDAARDLWHSTPVDTLFPPVLDGVGAGPDGARRTWTRLGVAPDSGCAGALDPALATALRSVGCLRVIRATYRDATSSDITTVGLVFTKADPVAMTTLRTGFADRHLAADTALVPTAYAVPGTIAASFGDRQRASWSIDILTQAPVVVYAVSGFADGRTVTAPEPAASATAAHATSPAAQAGLGFEARGLADSVERGIRTLTAARPAAHR
ncbi:hypothetical protein [Streptomyces sp. NBC_01497]|uniref:hypothetical protein n=1 Tax=Streptomyces sp. NBC_01497 TaxID=2903885 RepID=UPI002E3687BC|nr:hypothetical protein [Streptomyces sp. NBC_01497]